MAKFTVVYDNNKYDATLRTGWGFSCWVEGEEDQEHHYRVSSVGRAGGCAVSLHRRSGAADFCECL